MNPLEYVLSGAVVLSLGGALLAKHDADKFQEMYELCSAKKAMCEANYTGLDLEYNRLTRELEVVKVDYEKKLKERKVITVEKVIPKYITLENGDCNETSTVLDFIRNNHP